MKISRSIERVAPSLTLKITSLAKTMKEKGDAVVNLAAGEPDFDTAKYIKEAAVQAIKQGFTKYTAVSGSLELKQAIVRKFAQDNGLHYRPSQIVVCSGAKHALYNIFQVLCERGDEVLMASPYWVSYPQMVTLAGAKPRIIKTYADNQFKLDKKSLAKNITKRTKILIINSPGNPTGCVYSGKELAEIAKLALRHNLYIISDEIYEKLIFDGKKHLSCASLSKDVFNHTVVVNGVSKTYAMTGWRIGYLACAQERIIAAVNSLQSHSTSCPCSISQKAALAALSSPRKSQIRRMVQMLQSRRDYVIKALAEVAGLCVIHPDAAFYIFCNISKVRLDSMTFAQRLLKEAKVAVVPGKAFGRDDYIRLSFANSMEQIKEGMRRIKDWVVWVTR